MKNVANALDGIFHKNTYDTHYNGRHVTIEKNGDTLLNFASCSYLGLELHDNLRNASIDAINRYGTQFSSSRAFLSCGLYEKLETLCSALYPGTYPLITPTTTLGHLSALPVLIHHDDVVIVDKYAHASMQLTLKCVSLSAAPQHIPHSDMEALEHKINEAAQHGKRVWYIADGVYSMHGDVTPLTRLKGLLEAHPNFHLYIDDAHGMSWMGERGQGMVAQFFGTIPERMVLVVSLNKAFACAGGLIIFPSKEDRDRVRNLGSPMLFSGPIQPASLAACIASATLHLSGGIGAPQNKLASLIAYADQQCKDRNIVASYTGQTPIIFVPIGAPEQVFAQVHKLRAAGYFTDAAVYPMVPRQRGGIRISLTAHHEHEDIEGLVEVLSHSS